MYIYIYEYVIGDVGTPAMNQPGSHTHLKRHGK